MENRKMRSFPDEALEQVLPFISSHKDRNSLSLVCKSWYDTERWNRRHVFIGNCYAVSPEILVRRFTDVRSITIKGKHQFADAGLVPEGWGGHALPWIKAAVAAYPLLEELRFKRMVVTDESLELIARKLKNFMVLVLCRGCEGFSSDGLASIATRCRNLRMVDLDCMVDDLSGNWISSFPDSYTSLESLNISHLQPELPYSTLERLVDRCPNLKALRVNRFFPLEKLINCLLKAPQLVDISIGLFTMEGSPDARDEHARAFVGCDGLKSLSGLWDVDPCCLSLLYPVCSGLTFLDLTNSNLICSNMIVLLRRCPNLQRLWVDDYIEDRGLKEVAASCKELQELKVVCANASYSDVLDNPDGNPDDNLTERGLVSVAMGCPKLHYILYYCSQMTNAALFTVAKHRPNLTVLIINIHETPMGHLPDYTTHQPFDNGFSAILERCKNLKRLMIGCLFTDRLLEHIGIHGNKLEMLHLANGGNYDLGLHHVLSGCNNLRKLSLRNCPFGGLALLANSDRLETMRSLWMSSSTVTYQACKLLKAKHPRLNVEVMNEEGSFDSISDECDVENLYVYRTVAGSRLDVPGICFQLR